VVSKVVVEFEEEEEVDEEEPVPELEELL